MKWIGFFLLFFQVAFSWELQDRTTEEYVFEWNNPKDYDEAAELFFDAFMLAYTGYSPQKLGVKDIDTYVKGVIEKELLLKKNHPKDIHWLIAKSEGKVVGLLILDLSKFPEVQGRQMALSPYHYRNGLGEKLAKLTLENLPEAERFIAMTRIVNKVRVRFFEKLGFKRTDFVREGYDPEKYVGYEYIPERISQ